MSSPSPDYAALPARELSVREFDALVAERLFGWHGIRNTTIGTCGYRPGERPQPTGCGFSNRRTVPHYSTDPAAMMEVVEAMQSRSVYFDLKWDAGSDWRAQFFTGTAGMVERYADTPGRAVCLAALAAILPEGTVAHV